MDDVVICLTQDQVAKLKKHGHSATPSAIKNIVCKWQSFLNAGEAELTQRFKNQEIEILIDTVAAQARVDHLKARELWELSADRLAAIIAITHEDLYERCLGLSELAAMYIKEKVGERVVMHAGYSGRQKGDKRNGG